MAGCGRVLRAWFSVANVMHAEPGAGATGKADLPVRLSRAAMRAARGCVMVGWALRLESSDDGILPGRWLRS